MEDGGTDPSVEGYRGKDVPEPVERGLTRNPLPKFWKSPDVSSEVEEWGQDWSGLLNSQEADKGPLKQFAKMYLNIPNTKYVVTIEIV